MQSRVIISWICPNCAHLDLPFTNTSNESIDLEYEVPPSTCDYTEYLEKNNRTTSKGGGFGLYISETYTYKVRQDITNLD